MKNWQNVILQNIGNEEPFFIDWIKAGFSKPDYMQTSIKRFKHKHGLEIKTSSINEFMILLITEIKLN